MSSFDISLLEEFLKENIGPLFQRVEATSWGRKIASVDQKVEDALLVFEFATVVVKVDQCGF